MNIRILGTAVILGATVAATTAQATEGGGSVYPYGLNTVGPGMLAASGYYLYNYNSYFDASTTHNNAGASALPSFSARIRAHSLRLLSVSDTIKIMDGQFAWAVAQPYVDGKIKTPFAQGEDGDLGDTTIGPMLGWHSPTWHSIAGLDVTLPTGSYSMTRVFNPGRNEYAATPYYNFTWLPGANVDLNMRLNLTVNGKNRDTHYKSGTELGYDYSANYSFTKSWFAGLNGYMQRQLTDDTLNGAPVNGNGNRISAFSYGPQVGYRGDGWGIVSKWEHETSVKNKSMGDKYWLQLFVAIK